ncbi:MAG: hypothetical protein JWP81_1607 [Ferruginibacter sp.]|nr:hypothetical protein [Ferruginibacter sp.]
MIALIRHAQAKEMLDIVLLEAFKVWQISDKTDTAESCACFN